MILLHLRYPERLQTYGMIIIIFIILGLLYSITTSLLTYSANHLTVKSFIWMEENIYKICHIKCVSAFLQYIMSDFFSDENNKALYH